MARSGLKKVVKTVRGKKGSVKRSYWVRASGGKKAKSANAGGIRGFAQRHSGVIKGALGMAALAGAAYGSYKLGGHLGWKYGTQINNARSRAMDGLNRMGMRTPGHKTFNVTANGPVSASGSMGSGVNSPSASGPARGYRRLGGTVGAQSDNRGRGSGYRTLGGTIGASYAGKSAWESYPSAGRPATSALTQARVDHMSRAFDQQAQARRPAIRASGNVQVTRRRVRVLSSR